MFRKATPTVVRHLRRGAMARRVGVNPIAHRLALAASTSSVLNLPQSRFKSTVAAVDEDVCVHATDPPFKKILAANRGEIATRIHRAGAELGVHTAGIYSYEGKAV